LSFLHLLTIVKITLIRGRKIFYKSYSNNVKTISVQNTIYQKDHEAEKK